MHNCAMKKRGGGQKKRLITKTGWTAKYYFPAGTQGKRCLPLWGTDSLCRERADAFELRGKEGGGQIMMDLLHLEGELEFSGRRTGGEGVVR